MLLELGGSLGDVSQLELPCASPVVLLLLLLLLITALRSLNRRLFGGNVSKSAIDGLVTLVELLVLLPSPAPVLEHELGVVVRIAGVRIRLLTDFIH